MSEALTRLLPLIAPFDIEAARFRVTDNGGFISWRLMSRVPARAFIDYVEVAANEEAV